MDPRHPVVPTNPCRFGETNSGVMSPEPGWASPLTVSGLTHVGVASDRESNRGAAVTHLIRWCGGCQRHWRRTGGSGIGMLLRLSCVARSWRRASTRASLSPGGAGTRNSCHSDRFACRRRRVLSLAQTACTIGQLPPVQSTTSPTGSWQFESQDGKMELVAPGIGRPGAGGQQSDGILVQTAAVGLSSRK